MDDFEQGQDDYWHYEYPRKPTSAEYMAGWDIADEEFNWLTLSLEDEEED